MPYPFFATHLAIRTVALFSLQCQADLASDVSFDTSLTSTSGALAAGVSCDSETILASVTGANETSDPNVGATEGLLSKVTCAAACACSAACALINALASASA